MPKTLVLSIRTAREPQLNRVTPLGNQTGGRWHGDGKIMGRYWTHQGIVNERPEGERV